MIELFIKGGPVMIPIALCAFLATAITIERLIFFRQLKNSDERFWPALLSLCRLSRWEEAASLCAASPTPLAVLSREALSWRPSGPVEMKEAVLNASNRQLLRLERYLSALGTIANISTLLGLLGTVTGNIRAFGVLAASSSIADPSLLAGAIAEALITTAAGLIVSIPATVIYNWLLSGVNRQTVELETKTGELILLLGASPRAGAS